MSRSVDKVYSQSGTAGAIRFRRGEYPTNYATSGRGSLPRGAAGPSMVQRSSDAISGLGYLQKGGEVSQVRRVFRRLPPELLDDLPESPVDPIELTPASYREELKSRNRQRAVGCRERSPGEVVIGRSVVPTAAAASGDRLASQGKARITRKDVTDQRKQQSVKDKGPFKPGRKASDVPPPTHKHQPAQSVVRQECRQGTVFGVLSTPQEKKKIFPVRAESRQSSTQERLKSPYFRVSEQRDSTSESDRKSPITPKGTTSHSQDLRNNGENKDGSKDIVVSNLQSFCRAMLTVKNSPSDNNSNIRTRPPFVSYQTNEKNSPRKISPSLTGNREYSKVNGLHGKGDQNGKNHDKSKSKDSFSLQSPKLVKEVLKRMASQPSGRFSDPRGTLPDEFSDDETEVERKAQHIQETLSRREMDSTADETSHTSRRALPFVSTRPVKLRTFIPTNYSSPRNLNKATSDHDVQNDNLIEEVLLSQNSSHQCCSPEGHIQNVKFAQSPINELSPNLKKTQVQDISGKRSPNANVDQNQAVKDAKIETPSKSPRCLEVNDPENEENELSSLDVVASGVHPLANCSLHNDVTVRPSTSSVDSGMCSPHQAYFVVVAVDFGTTYSGYAFSFTRDPDNVHMMRKWEGGDPGVINQKTPTTVLLSPDGEFHSFGYSARDFFHDLDPEDAKRWMYFEKFKMALHTTENLNHETTIKAANGKSVSAVKVFAHALRYFKQHALQELSDQSGTVIMNEDVRWVVTVPAIWRQPAKQFMRTAAYEAGIASSDCPDQLLIALEPEAASVYCRRLRIHQLVPEACQPPRLTVRTGVDSPEKGVEPAVAEKKGTHYMVVDCGGGTVDITVHEILDEQGTIRELHKATGGPYGSVGIDMEFEKLLNDVFGADFIEQFKIKRSAAFIDLMIAFEARKRNASPFKITPLNISLPFSLIDYFKKCKGTSVESAIKKFGNKDIKWSSQGMLRLEPAAMLRLFHSTLEAIKEHIRAVLDDAAVQNVNYLFLVGGFAESQILQKEVRESFSNRVKVIIPQGVSLAILKGAVLFGMDPTIVSARRSRMTYGVGVLNRFIHGVHPIDKLVVKDGVEWCADVFDKFVITDQSVAHGDMVVRSYTPARAGQSCSVIHIYSSENDNAKFITDCGVKRCGSLILDLSEAKYLPPTGRREIEMIMIFGDTEIKVTALDVTTGKCVKADIDFLNQ